MRWFWFFIVVLVMLTGVLYADRVGTERTIETQPIARDLIVHRPVISERAPEHKPEPIAVPEVQDVQREVLEEREAIELAAQQGPGVDEGVIEEEMIVVAQQEVAQEEAEADANEFIPEPIPASPELIETEMAIEPEAQPKDAPEVLPEPSSDPELIQSSIEVPIIEPVPEPTPAPTYQRNDDGSMKILATGSLITGSGILPDPYVVDWNTLRSVERGYNPKSGKDYLPDWLDVLDGKHVRIVGNTLVPVIASTTRELLVMQNPWDGCCVGIPPSPYDAIEVTLNHDVDFGSSAVGYGTVEGVFVLDPYVVDGWVLGLYLIEEASYRSGDGIAFDDF